MAPSTCPCYGACRLLRVLIFLRVRVFRLRVVRLRVVRLRTLLHLCVLLRVLVLVLRTCHVLVLVASVRSESKEITLCDKESY